MRYVFLFITLSSLAVFAKDPKPAKITAPSHGVKTPGVLIPYANLKPEAEIALPSPPTGVLLTDSVAIATATGILKFDPKTNKPFDPPRDIKELDKPCGGLLNAFSSEWTAVCGTSSLAKIEGQAPRRGRFGEGKGEAKGEAKAEAKGEARPEAKSERKGGGEANSEAKGPRRPPAAAKPQFIATGMAPTATASLASSEDSVWLLADSKTTLLRIDPRENNVVAEIRLPARCTSILSAERSLWVACPTEAKLIRINPATNLVEKRIEVPAEPISIAAGESSIWVLSRKEGKVSRIDPKTNKVTATVELSVPNADGTLAFGEGYLWASVPGFPVMRIAPATDKAVQQFHGPGGGFIYFGQGSLWVGSPSSSTLIRFDPKRVLATLAD